jgi:hypothetical protein
MDWMTEEQVATTIAVLKAYADGTLQTDLCDELDEAIQKAFDVLLDGWIEHDPEGEMI